MTKSKPATKKNEWTVKDSCSLYGLDLWGEEYFSINDSGNVTVSPQGKEGNSLELTHLLEELKGRNLNTPLLLRFDDILEDRLKKLHQAFENAINQYGYNNDYQGVFPIKCNQQRHVVEEIVTIGRKWHFGLEAGSKAELLIALALVNDPKAFLICNGYKDNRYIETTILARQLGRQPIVVIEQSDEVGRIIKASQKLGAAPLIGIRAKLSNQSSGRWGNSVGEKSKFGLSIPEILKAVQELTAAGLLNELILLHFHVGSQINDIAILKNALQEASQIYVELNRLGAPMGHLDVGGGLGVDYDGSRTATSASTNYSLQNYANDVVATIQECCKAKKVKVPKLISESGRFLSSHFSILIFNVLGTSSVPTQIAIETSNECLSVKNLRETLMILHQICEEKKIDVSKLQEAWNDALKFKEDALNAFRLGFIDLTERATAEQLTWACAKQIAAHLPNDLKIPKELLAINKGLTETYYANISIFRSAPDTWAIQQLFPLLPIHRLQEKPDQLGHFADLTCDSDGKLARFINNGQEKFLLELHTVKANENYWIGMFLGGAYQEVMGNLHNLFGSTNAIHIRLTKNGKYKLDHVVRGNSKSDVLQAMEHDSEQLLERIRMASESAIQQGSLKINDAQRLIEHVETSLRQSTYLQE
ncbi:MULTISPECIES: biosynthetic arginine decarboxylase [Prochlorococcus]|uniref:Biosynthetic arginine decarboxylase n=1 Tax=Prochlorococcus marinus (strain SARG / CCMP1375 / SS120) TaxID=167539 RepID=SPEA_PROMA|nr:MULTISPECIES: biosynthetic arginine decarboxylase [Prochlorococcus]Q7VEG4.1 RecName: Full=Biosynthetic arginine decarboxylase; Short=ADC [Prochlorococcus marinus subsp. marinus str. CCMP1375]AAP99095.1 Arginine decarboxylase [Prochlorococcus marinus subsp. marinus str. CCMP1375]KGG11647.1 Biosynthetic arginine decarboxylase [Prochlorococcus marinus str. LG]KGG22345.1 Biosynthetic arginine decarboxylase [Prochlorococcus marinus str. SS2]KGG22680.1 Biosynthetic arginine decarboxylase [Prochlo